MTQDTMLHMIWLRSQEGPMHQSVVILTVIAVQQVEGVGFLVRGDAVSLLTQPLSQN